MLKDNQDSKAIVAKQLYPEREKAMAMILEDVSSKCTSSLSKQDKNQTSISQLRRKRNRITFLLLWAAAQRWFGDYPSRFSEQSLSDENVFQKNPLYLPLLSNNDNDNNDDDDDGDNNDDNNNAADADGPEPKTSREWVWPTRNMQDQFSIRPSSETEENSLRCKTDIKLELERAGMGFFKALSQFETSSILDQAYLIFISSPLTFSFWALLNISFNLVEPLKPKTKPGPLSSSLSPFQLNTGQVCPKNERIRVSQTCPAADQNFFSR